ncbi:MAG: hypothetical protein ACM3SQ_05330 [Betaproteobacteria bacterium]
MLSNRLAFAAVAVACVAAAGVGGYLASRQNVAPTPVAAAVAPASSPTAAPQAGPVDATEGIVKTPAAEPAPAAPVARPARRAEPTPRVTAQRTSRTARTQPPAIPVEPVWPTDTATPPPPPPATAEANSTQPAAPDDAESRAQYEELVVAADSVIGLQIDHSVSSETARVEDRVEARVTRDVRVGNEVAIPAGTEAIGSVTQVERGGKFKERARLGIRFHTLVLADGTRLPISTETIYREGEGPGDAAASRIGGGAVAGAILGAILGGARGAAIGATTGAGAGTAVVASGDRRFVTLPAGSPMTVRILAPVSVTVEK